MILPEASLAKRLLLPELKLIEMRSICELWVEKVSEFEVCCRCASKSSTVYDHRWVRVRDIALQLGEPLKLRVLKRRFYCRPCKRPFTEPVGGILPRRRTTQRFRRAVQEACEKFVSLSLVRREFRVSSDFIHRVYYEQLELKRRMNQNYPWPKAIGIDEHGFGRNPQYGHREFFSLIVDHVNKRVMEAVHGKSQAILEQNLAHIEGRSNVRFATIDLCEPFRNFIHSFFPEARIIADKFHVLRLLSPQILKLRRQIAGNNSNRKARRLLLCSSKNLDYFDRLAIRRYLEKYPELAELYDWKEQMHSLYRIKGFRRAQAAFDAIVIAMQLSKLPQIKTLRNTLVKWREEILNYFDKPLTNARLEGFNNKASLVRRRAYGYRSPKNYRLRLLSACV